MSSLILFLFSSLLILHVTKAKLYDKYNYYESNFPNAGQDCLSEHNKLRQRHDVQPLTYDSQLEKYAIERAKFMAKTDIFKHPSDLPYGENLYWRSGSTPTCKDATDAWYNEISLYSYKNPKFSSSTGHFTQLIWKKTSSLGCASAKSKRTGRVYIACNYWPRGNVLGRFADNVVYPRNWSKK